MYILKKTISSFLLPLPLSVELLVVGLILLWFTGRQRAGKLIVSLATILLIIFGNASFAAKLLRPLEWKYPPRVSVSQVEATSAPKPIKYVVVLAGGFWFDPKIPATGQIEADTTTRLVEGIVEYRQLSGSKLILSGGKGFDPVPRAELMSKVAQSLGVNPEDIILETQSGDTDDEARFIKPIVGQEPFVLVTSAWHMPRSMALFRKQGMNPIPVSTDYLGRRHERLGPDRIFPTAMGLLKTDRAIHEYLGLAWEKLRGDI